MRSFLTSFICCLMIAAANAKDLDFTEEVHLSASPEKVWRAITEPEMVNRYHFAPLSKIELKKGGSVVYGTQEEVMISGTIMDFEENVRLIHTFRFGPQNHPATDQDPDTLVSYRISKDGEKTLLSLTHSGFSADNQTRANIIEGWPHLLAQLKATLEAE